MIDYTAPETALLDLDWLLDQASLFITPNAIDCELEARLEACHFKIGAPVCAEAREEVKRYLAHLSIEEIYDPYLDRMGKLELVCRKAEVERRIERLLTEVLARTTRRAA